jgi:hypothetical protein
VSYQVERNRETTDRSAAITVADQVFAVAQSGEAVACDYSVAPVQLNACMAASSAVTRITTGDSCSWTVSTNAPWLTITSGTSGTGSSDISMAFTANYDAPREGTVLVRWPTPTAGQNVRLAQAGCVYGVTRSAFSFSAAGGSGTFDVVQQSDPLECGGPEQDRCVWTAVSDAAWITILTPMPRTGDSRVAFTTAPNTGAAPRSGTITVRDKTIQITQTGQ